MVVTWADDISSTVYYDPSEDPGFRRLRPTPPRDAGGKKKQSIPNINKNVMRKFLRDAEPRRIWHQKYKAFLAEHPWLKDTNALRAAHEALDKTGNRRLLEHLLLTTNEGTPLSSSLPTRR
jgi:hypothetical protein